ncbi:Crp/Fnr family transcriptional regulator [Solimonas terrae]|uniref:Helix-turn-helix domain-containing protein n=1 Tax=Solimonas terrae TaxID=1396819 RepID=A0A6M2BMG6_9GAMM|nr:cyclic nucleotide-binding domain-containing protein [Solimonas terrae]NGY03203.1 helix-turn-helix domain-containing protein [Solimonas terrae]
MLNQNVSNTVAALPCTSCLRHSACLGACVQDAVGAEGENACITTMTLQRGQPLFRAGDAVDAVYIVQSGALKSRRHSYNGEEEIVAFRLPGDSVGLDAIGNREHGTEAVALCSTRVCQVPLTTLRREVHASPAVASHLLDDLGREIGQLQEHLRDERRTAQVRIAAFLLAQLQRRRRLFGAQIDRFTLPMTRIDVGRFLGLATETVSRMFTRLQTDGVIACEGNSVQVLDSTMLARLADVAESFQPLARVA